MDVVFLNIAFYENPNDDVSIIKALSSVFRVYIDNLLWDEIFEVMQDNEYIPEKGCFLYYPTALLLKEHDSKSFNTLFELVNLAYLYWRSRDRLFKLGYLPGML